MTFARDARHMFGWASEVGAAAVARRILGDDIVAFRSGDGELAALADPCPHHAGSLSLGSVADGLMRYPYYRLEFDGSGISGSARVRHRLARLVNAERQRAA